MSRLLETVDAVHRCDAGAPYLDDLVVPLLGMCVDSLAEDVTETNEVDDRSLERITCANIRP